MSEPPHLLRIADLDDAAVARVLDRARRWPSDSVGAPPGRVIGLLFLEPSLRTRAGFAVAAARMGWSSVDVETARDGPRSMPESWEDTIRTFAGYVDGLVVRSGRPLDRGVLDGLAGVPVINGGDGGPDAEHPTQALIDLAAFERHGRVEDLTIAVCGDLRMRAVRSVLRLLDRHPPRRLVLVTDPDLLDGFDLPPGLASITDRRPLPELDDVDVLYVAGMPHECLPEPQRDELRVTADVLDRLPASAVVLSPLPLLDEIDAAARCNPRVRMFEQSAQGIAVRIAVLHELVR